MKQLISYLALGLSVLALLLGLHSTGLVGLGAAAPNVNCNGRSYCTAWNDILYRNGSSTQQISANNISATGTVALSGSLTVTGTTTISGSGNCGTFAWGPGSLQANNSTSTAIAIPNAVIGDMVVTSFATTTSANLWQLTGTVSATGIARVNILNISSASITFGSGTSTAQACLLK